MHRKDFDSLARKATLYAARRLNRRGNRDPELPQQIACIALEEFIHSHHGGPHAFRLLCAVIDDLIDRSAERAN